MKAAAARTLRETRGFAGRGPRSPYQPARASISEAFIRGLDPCNRGLTGAQLAAV